MQGLYETLRNLGPTRLALMGAVAAGLIGFFIYLASQLGTQEMALLYQELESEDSAAVVSQLEQRGVPFRLEANGDRILVPADQVARTRLAMAEQGLPSGGSIGYEIFDRSEGLGTSSFVQNVNHLRAMEGELARTIRAIDNVEQARVHLVLPQREIFSRERQDPSASVVLLMRGKERLTPGQVQGIQHLLASAVPYMKPEMVSIIDNQGTLLARGEGDDGVTAMLTNAEEMRRSYEHRLARAVEDLIERSVGLGNVRVEVAAQMNFDRMTENAETFDPDSQVERSVQVVEEQESSQDGQGEMAVTAGNNLPDDLPDLGGGEGSMSQASRTEETVNFEISKRVTTHVRESGGVERLSVAVLVNGRYVTAPDGTRTYQERSAEELEQIAALVRSAVGYSTDRGDTLEVINMRFVDPTEEMVATAPTGFLGLTEGRLMRVAELVVLGVVAVLVLLLVVRPLVTRLMEGGAGQPAMAGAEGGMMLGDYSADLPQLTSPRSRAPVPVSGAGYAEGGAENALAPYEEEEVDIESMIDLEKVEGRVRASSIRKIGEIVEKHPEEAASILRNWLYHQA